MQLSPDFKVEGKHRTAAEALVLADEIAQAVGQLLIGAIKPKDLDVGLLTGAVQALRDHVKLAPASPAPPPAMPPTDEERPNDPDHPDGYREAPNEWINRNLDAVRWLIDNHAAIRVALAR